MLAEDKGTPPRSAIAIVYVTVRRNFAKPKFEKQTVEATILETQNTGITIATVSAKDEDKLVSTTSKITS